MNATRLLLALLLVWSAIPAAPEAVMGNHAQPTSPRFDSMPDACCTHVHVANHCPNAGACSCPTPAATAVAHARVGLTPLLWEADPVLSIPLRVTRPLHPPA